MSEHSQCVVGIRNGKLIDVINPNIEDIRIEDIAHALSNQCRFAGHTRRFYSIAEHSVNVANLVSKENKLWALLHDASEAYLTDMVTPIKRIMPAYEYIERRVQSVICEAFKLPYEMPEEVKQADMTMLATEISDYIGGDPVAWGVHAVPMSSRLKRPLRPLDAMNAFLDMFYDLTEEE